MSKRPPNRHSHQKEHNEFGIKNWFIRIGISDGNLRNRMKQAFLEDYEFDFSNNSDNAKNNFIQNRWNEFTNYVQANKKLFQ